MLMKNLVPRDVAARYGQEAVAIIDAGEYIAGNGQRVEIAADVRQAVANTRVYLPDCPLSAITPRFETSKLEVTNETTLHAARRLIADGERPVALNFASATHPGGGFLTGARAQEESLCWSSALYACLKNQPMYEFHRQRHDPLYTDYTLYSPAVPVFRDDDGRLLDEPYRCSFITSAAVNASVLLERDPSQRGSIGPAMASRIRKVLTIGAAHGHTAIVLGAWGCGAFGNDGHEIAALFQQALTGEFHGIYKAVVFAILDFSNDQHFIGPFTSAFDLV
jgi:uncharacterized protein (TIGR02452 family)